MFWNSLEAGESAGAELVLLLGLTIFFFPLTSGLVLNLVLLPSCLPADRGVWGSGGFLGFWVESLSSLVEFILPVSSPTDGSCSLVFTTGSGVPSSIG